MRALSIQVQPQRTTGLNVAHLTAVFSEVAALTSLVSHHHFDRGHDNGPYLNFTFGTGEAASLWRVVRERLYEDEELGPHMRVASMAMCSGEAGWDDYLLLAHFDPEVTLDPDTSL